MKKKKTGLSHDELLWGMMFDLKADTEAEQQLLAPLFRATNPRVTTNGVTNPELMESLALRAKHYREPEQPEYGWREPMKK